MRRRSNISFGRFIVLTVHRQNTEFASHTFFPPLQHRMAVDLPVTTSPNYMDHNTEQIERRMMSAMKFCFGADTNDNNVKTYNYQYSPALIPEIVATAAPWVDC